MLVYQYAYHGDDFAYRFVLRSDQTHQMPGWPAEAPFPPLSPRAAIERSCAVVQRLLAQDVGVFDPVVVSCEPVRAGASDGYYLVEWMVPHLVGGGTGCFRIPVLFDGSTPTPVKAKFEDRFALYRLTEPVSPRAAPSQS